MTAAKIKELEALEKENAENEKWLSDNKISKTDKIEKEKSRRLTMAVEYGQALAPLRVELEAHIKEVDARERRKAEVKEAKDGLKDIEHFHSMLIAFDFMEFDNKQALVNEVGEEVKRREAIIDAKRKKQNAA